MILNYSQICVDDRATAIIKSVLKEDHTHLREVSQFWMESMLLFRAAVSLVLRFSLLCFGMAEEKQYQAVVERGEWQYSASPLVSYGLLLCTYAWLPKVCLCIRTGSDRSCQHASRHKVSAQLAWTRPSTLIISS
jgi:hypothetical protein